MRQHLTDNVTAERLDKVVMVDVGCDKVQIGKVARPIDGDLPFT